MKFIVICLVFGFAASGRAEWWMNTSDIFEKHSATCAKENEVDLAVFEKLRTDKNPDYNFLDEKKYKCFFLCVATKGGIIDDEGKANIEMIVEKFEIDDKETFVKTSKTCMENAKEMDKCERFSELAGCMLTEFKP